MRTVGVGIVVHKGDCLLLGLRGPGSKRGAGCWALPGGMLEPGESIVEAVHRECRQETGMTISMTHHAFDLPAFATTDHFPIENHISVWVYSRWSSGEPKLLEPKKCLEWKWVFPHELASIPGVLDPNAEQYYWLPLPMLRRRLSPYFSASF